MFIDILCNERTHGNHKVYHNSIALVSLSIFQTRNIWQESATCEIEKGPHSLASQENKSWTMSKRWDTNTPKNVCWTKWSISVGKSKCMAAQTVSTSSVRCARWSIITFQKRFAICMVFTPEEGSKFGPKHENDQTPTQANSRKNKGMRHVYIYIYIHRKKHTLEDLNSKHISTVNIYCKCNTNNKAPWGKQTTEHNILSGSNGELEGISANWHTWTKFNHLAWNKSFSILLNSKNSNTEEMDKPVENHVNDDLHLDAKK